MLLISKQKGFFLLLQMAAAAVFFGRAYQHIFWDAPYRTVLWDEQWMSGIVNTVFGISWEVYVSDPGIDIFIQKIIVGIGILYAIFGVLTIFIKKLPAVAHHFLWIGSACLFLLSVCYMKVYFFSLGQLLEYTLQVLSPLFLFLYIRQKFALRQLIFLMKVGVALTFICHGLYAYGYYPQPGRFMQMTISILKVDDVIASNFLKVAGILDFAVGILIFLPGKWAKPVVVYAIIWGFLTSFARIVANFYPEIWLNSLHQSVFEFVYRMPHFLIPLAMYFYYENNLFSSQQPAAISNYKV